MTSQYVKTSQVPPSSADIFNDMMCSREIEEERMDLKAGALGFVAAYIMGGLIHILLVFAVMVILIRVIQGQRL